MAKGYLIVQVLITDSQAYARYGEAATKVLEAHQARLIVKPGSAIVKEGNARPRNLIFEFESFEKAKEFWDSPEYQAAKSLREGAAEGEFILIEGVD